MKNKNYWDIYSHEIMPRINKADLLLKTSEASIQPHMAASVLDISLSELFLIMSRLHIASVTSESFPLIMLHGSSTLCRLFARELRLGCSESYEPMQIASIYSLDPDKVRKAFDALGISSADSSQLKQIFRLIPSD